MIPDYELAALQAEMEVEKVRANICAHSGQYADAKIHADLMDSIAARIRELGEKREETQTLVVGGGGREEILIRKLQGEIEYLNSKLARQGKGSLPEVPSDYLRQTPAPQPEDAVELAGEKEANRAYFAKPADAPKLRTQISVRAEERRDIIAQRDTAVEAMRKAWGHLGSEGHYLEGKITWLDVHEAWEALDSLLSRHDQPEEEKNCSACAEKMVDSGKLDCSGCHHNEVDGIEKADAGKEGGR